ncbi:PLP-dependent aminotransferase family protein [Cellvibrio sp. NN19]|uniref:aminotransferase-like domain-containing protein n=1 Tax=Cellvibrio chitinivorans TaxID=3102792 RepID=UPI002B401501|nr:PLP-dependent aminotransferase family protein [Cellvibrio sp. NN19]
MDILYRKLANELAGLIQSGSFQSGDRMPGVRQQARQHQLSIATVISAYRQLEDWGLVEVRNRSGFYVKNPRITPLPAPRMHVTTMRPAPVTGQDMVLQLVKAANDPAIVQLGAAVPASEFLPTRAIEQALTKVARHHRVRSANYEFSPGAPELRRQISRRLAEAGCAVHPDNLVITNGCQEALFLALRAVTQPGDVVAIESPTFYGLLQVIDALGLEALEIPATSQTGMSLEALELALSRWPVKACVVTPNFSNPLGSTMPEANKQRLVSMLKARQITLIEDDIYSDLGFGQVRPSLLKALDDNVILCSSVSKTLSPGLRVGWIAGGIHQERIEYLKYVLNLATATAPQLAVAELLENGQYERHLRRVRGDYAQAVTRMTKLILDNFPEGTKISQPQGGFVIWLELPGNIDSFDLAKHALAAGISIAPGPIFSASQKYTSFVRLCCACEWNARVESAVIKLAGLIRNQIPKTNPIN